MPISRREFDSFEERNRERTNAERVLEFLARNPHRAYKANEIADATEIPYGSIHPVLGRLADRNLVEHKRPYWAVGDLEHVRDAFVFHSSASFLDEKLGPESRREWLQAAEGDDGVDEE